MASDEAVSWSVFLHIHRLHPEADHDFATFLNDLRPESLESFETFSNSDIGAESFLALNYHRESLKELKINGIKADAIPAISLMKGCTNLTTLMLAESGRATQNLEKDHNDVFLETIAWLIQCKGLKSISIDKMLSASALLAPVLLDHSIKLTSLELDGYSMCESRNFHQALASQVSLQSLWLNGEPSESPRDNDILVNSLIKLENLTDLRLRYIADAFTSQHIRRLAQRLPKLETLWTHGWAITDVVWRDLASLHHLRKLEFNAITRFTANGILSFIRELGPGNQGLELGITKSDEDFDLSEEEQTTIRETLKLQVDGHFDFALARGKCCSIAF